MPSESPKTVPSQFRLPLWAAEFVAETAASYGGTKTDVVVRALECLRERETAALMADGYREMSGDSLRLAEDSLAAAEASWPEW